MRRGGRQVAAWRREGRVDGTYGELGSGRLVVGGRGRVDGEVELLEGAALLPGLRGGIRWRGGVVRWGELAEWCAWWGWR